MAITIKTYKSQNMGGAAAVNGGAMSNNLAPTNTASAAFPAALPSELAAGFTRYRKLFKKIEDSDDGTAFNTRQFVIKNTPGDDRVTIAVGTWIDNEDDLSSPSWYGGGALDSNVAQGATSIDVLVENGATTLFRNGDWVAITDRTDLTDDQTGNLEFVQVSGTPSVAGDVVTVPLGSGLSNAYLAADTFVSSCINWGDLSATISNVAESLSNGATFDEASVVAHTIGAVYDTITLTFSNSSAFDAAGAALGSLGAGTTGSNFAPTNPNTGTPYFTIPSSVWSGSPSAGDTVSFLLTPLGCPHWLRQVAPAGANSASGNSYTVALYFES